MRVQIQSVHYITQSLRLRASSSFRSFFATSLSVALAASLVFQPCIVWATVSDPSPGKSVSPIPNLNAFIPEVDGLDPATLESLQLDSGGLPVNLPRPLEEIAREKQSDADQAPSWVKELRSKPVSTYFRAGLRDHSSEWNESAQRLLNDAEKLHLYFESRDTTGLYANFVEKKLGPFVLSLTADQLRSPLRRSQLTQPIGHWTLETLVVTQQVGYLGRLPGFVKNTLGLITGRHLRGATGLAGITVITSVIIYACSKWGFGPVFIGTAILSSIGSAFNAGPVARILSAATSWFFNPINEFVNVLVVRYFGGAEAWMHHKLDKFNPKPRADAPPTTNTDNHTPKVARVDEDGFSVANMSATEQEANWRLSQEIWVSVAKRFGQLLRDTHHHGRVLMMISWHDEQLASTHVESVDTKLTVLEIQSKQILFDRKNRIMTDSRRTEEQKDHDLEELERTYERFLDLNESMWPMDWDESTPELLQAIRDLEAAKDTLRRLGFNQGALDQIIEIERYREIAISTLITALAVNEIRSFMTAEANRNLEQKARRTVRAVRYGFQLQMYIDRYLPLVQDQISRMGYDIAGRKAERETDRPRRMQMMSDLPRAIRCEALFANPSPR